MPYTKSTVPDYVPASKAAQWAEVWNSAHEKAKKDGKSDADAEASAFAQANAVAGPKSEKKGSNDMKREVRYLMHTEIRAVDDSKRTIEGYAAVFNQPSSPLLGFTERVMPGAFKRALAEKQDIRFLMNHDPNLLMGRTKNSTLRLSEDAKGLKFSNDLPDTQAARDLYTLIKRGDMDQCSFSFVAVKDTWGKEQNAAGDWVASRSLDDVDLLDASAVTYPVYEQTEVNARAMFPDGVPAEVRSAIAAGHNPPAQKAEERCSFEEIIAEVNEELKEKFGCAPNTTWGQYFVVETYPDHAIVMKSDDRSYWSVPLSIGTDDEVTLGDLAPVEQSFTPSAQMVERAKQEGERRGFPEVATAGNAVSLGMSDAIAEDLKAEWVDAYNEAWEDAVRGKKLAPKEAEAYAKAAADKCIHDKLTPPASGVGEPDPSEMPENMSEIDDDSDAELYSEEHSAKNSLAEGRRFVAGHNDHEDCTDPSCPCQDRMVDPDQVDEWGDDPDYTMDEEDDNAEEDRSLEGRRRVIEKRRSAGKEIRQVLTKRVGGKNLTKGAFAFVGDPAKTATWKYPIHDAAHVRNALARWGQHVGIPADQEAGVYKKIVAAAKKFGIDVAESKSLRVASRKAEKRMHNTLAGILAQHPEAKDEPVYKEIVAALKTYLIGKEAIEELEEGNEAPPEEQDDASMRARMEMALKLRMLQ